MDHEITHLRIVDAGLRRAPPGGMGLPVIRKNAHDVQLREVLEFDRVGGDQLAAKDEVQQLLRKFGRRASQAA